MKTDPELKLERAVGLRVIADKAQELHEKGADPIDVRTFISGARKELAKQAPDPESYSKALRAAVAFKEAGADI